MVGFSMVKSMQKDGKQDGKQDGSWEVGRLLRLDFGKIQGN